MLESGLKFVLRWNRKSDAEKAEFRHRIAVIRYKARTLLATIVSPLPLSLPYLLRVTGTDKHQPNGHQYGFIYEDYFRPFRYERTKLLEIGIGGYDYALGGESLIAWRAYFPFGKIVACDLHLHQGMASRRTRIRQMDQSSIPDLDKLVKDEGPFNIIIDDGSHMNAHQILTFQHLFNALSDGGIYVIEDVMTSYWKFSYWDGKSLEEQDTQTCMGWFTKLAHYVNFEEFETTDGVDPIMLTLAPSIGHILFRKNLVIIMKETGSKGAVSINRLKKWK